MRTWWRASFSIRTICCAYEVLPGGMEGRDDVVGGHLAAIVELDALAQRDLPHLLRAVGLHRGGELGLNLEGVVHVGEAVVTRSSC
jgi:hypothetical protein